MTGEERIWKPVSTISRITWCAALAAAFVVLPGAASAASGTFSADAIQSALNATVFIEVERSFHGERFTTTGTGFFITADGHIVTNSHVVSEWMDIPVRDEWYAVEVNVLTIKVVMRPRTPHERVLLAKVVAIDRTRDLALLKASLPSPDYLDLAPDTTVGLLEEVFVLGFPFGDALILNEKGWVSRDGGFPEVSINSGRVTSLRRDDHGNVVALQTDASINPGNSGGPMINAEGELVGVVYAKFSDTGIGFAIAPGRVWAFLQGQKIKAVFVPSVVSFERRPVLLKVSTGALLDAAAGGRAVVEASGLASRSVDLVKAESGWRAALDFPANADGTAAESYVVHVFLEDAKGRPVADHRYRIRRQDQTVPKGPDEQEATRVIDNEMTLSDYARKQAAAQAVDDGVVLSHKPPTRSSGSSDDDDEKPPESERPPVDLENLKRTAKTYYRGGNYAAAAEILAQIVAADPSDEVSRDYLELARERLRLSGNTQRTDAFEPTDVESPAVLPPSTATITFYLPSSTNGGVIDIRLDGEPLPSHTFEVSDQSRVFHTITIDAGEHVLETELRIGKRSRGRFSFERHFKVDSRWTLRFDVPPKNGDATAYLVERRD